MSYAYVDKIVLSEEIHWIEEYEITKTNLK